MWWVVAYVDINEVARGLSQFSFMCKGVRVSRSLSYCIVHPSMRLWLTWPLTGLRSPRGRAQIDNINLWFTT
jgi:hypothetical protein